MDKFIVKSFEKVMARNWNRWYFAIDIHDTCLKANYSADELPDEFFPYAEEALRELSSRPYCCLILFTCSHDADIEKYLALFKARGIHFDYVNENPEVTNTDYANFDKKFYTNAYAEDKAGFDPERDWLKILKALKYIDTHYSDYWQNHLNIMECGHEDNQTNAHR